MARWLHMKDYLTVKNADFTLKNQDAKGTSLLTRVRATTAGIVNGNRRFYRPDRMMQGVDSWLPKKPRSSRPVLVGHADEGTVLGRVVEAKYVDESYKYKSEHTQIRDSAFYNTDSRKKIDVFKSIDWIVDNLLPKEEYAGLGYIELGLKVTNPDAIQKLLREEYLTVSVGFKTDSGICSICHTDWAQDDRCEHAMGEVYDGKTMFLISGNFEYEEVSFVNFPADPFAHALSTTGVQDSKQWANERNSRMFFLGLPARQQAAIAQTTGLQFSDSLYAADIQIAEDPMPETVVDNKLEAEISSVPNKDMSKEEQDAVLAEAGGVKTAAQADAEATVVLPEIIQKVCDALAGLDKFKAIDIKGSDLAKMLIELDKAYGQYDDDKKYMVRAALYSLMDRWSADSAVEYYKSQLASDKDFVILPKADLKDKEDKLSQNAAELDAKTKEADIFRSQMAGTFLNFKKGLANQIVLFKSLSGDKSYKGLDATQLKAKVDELMKRHVSSLQDTVSDIMSELKWVEAPAAAETAAAEVKTTDAIREEKSLETQPTVNDNKQVAEPTPGASQDAEGAGAKRDFDLHRARLAAMAPMERRLYLAELTYKIQQAK